MSSCFIIRKPRPGAGQSKNHCYLSAAIKVIQRRRVVQSGAFNINHRPYPHFFKLHPRDSFNAYKGLAARGQTIDIIGSAINLKAGVAVRFDGHQWYGSPADLAPV